MNLALFIFLVVLLTGSHWLIFWGTSVVALRYHNSSPGTVIPIGIAVRAFNDTLRELRTTVVWLLGFFTLLSIGLLGIILRCLSLMT